MTMHSPITAPQTRETQLLAPEALLAPVDAPEAAPKARPRLGRKLAKRALVGLLLATAAVAACGYGYQYWTVGRFLVATDDAYVKADSTVVSARVPGYIADVLVGDNQQVEAGQVLARIDDRDLRAALDRAQAAVDAAEAAVKNLDARRALQDSVIAEQAAQVAATEASLDFATRDHARYRDLAKTGYGSQQRAQQADADFQKLTAQHARDRAALDTARSQLAVIASDRAKAVATLEESRAAARQAALNLSYATIVAPVDGTVGARTLRVGQYVQPGTQLLAIVPLDAVYVVANFKETQLAHVHPGQPVEVSVDGLEGATLTGHVDSLSPASGLEFALLPPDNATGNFTKIVQRIPVRIALDDAGAALLRAGMSVEPTIDTRASAGTGSSGS